MKKIKLFILTVSLMISTNVAQAFELEMDNQAKIITGAGAFLLVGGALLAETVNGTYEKANAHQIKEMMKALKGKPRFDYLILESMPPRLGSMQIDDYIAHRRGEVVKALQISMREGGDLNLISEKLTIHHVDAETGRLIASKGLDAANGKVKKTVYSSLEEYESKWSQEGQGRSAIGGDYQVKGKYKAKPLPLRAIVAKRVFQGMYITGGAMVASQVVRSLTGSAKADEVSVINATNAGVKDAPSDRTESLTVESGRYYGE